MQRCPQVMAHGDFSSYSCHMCRLLFGNLVYFVVGRIANAVIFAVYSSRCAIYFKMCGQRCPCTRQDLDFFLKKQQTCTNYVGPKNDDWSNVRDIWLCGLPDVPERFSMFTRGEYVWHLKQAHAGRWAGNSRACLHHSWYVYADLMGHDGSAGFNLTLAHLKLDLHFRDSC